MSTFNNAFANQDSARSILNDVSALETKLFVTGVVTGGDVTCVREELEARLKRIARNANAILSRSQATIDAVKAGVA